MLVFGEIGKREKYVHGKIEKTGYSSFVFIIFILFFPFVKLVFAIKD